MVVMSSLVPARLGAGVAFSNASTIFASAVFRSLKPHSFRVSSEGAAKPSRLLGRIESHILSLQLVDFFDNFFVERRIEEFNVGDSCV
jgi:hypothetical protein